MYAFALTPPSRLECTYFMNGPFQYILLNETLQEIENLIL